MHSATGRAGRHGNVKIDEQKKGSEMRGLFFCPVDLVRDLSHLTQKLVGLFFQGPLFQPRGPLFRLFMLQSSHTSPREDGVTSVGFVF